MPSSRRINSQKPGSLSKQFKRRVFWLLIFLGITLITIPRIQYNLQAFQQKIAEPIQPGFRESIPIDQASIPKQIIIPTIGIDIPVVKSTLKNGYWETSETTASYGEGSAVPGQGSNTVIFAHAREGLFLPLRNLKVNERVYLFTEQRYFTYVVETISEVKPTDTYIVKPTDSERLTMFTCSGFFDSKRLVVVAKPM